MLPYRQDSFPDVLPEDSWVESPPWHRSHQPATRLSGNPSGKKGRILVKSYPVVFALLFLALAVTPAWAQTLYSNGLCKLAPLVRPSAISPGGCNTDAWTINFGYVVSDTFTVSGFSPMQGFDFVVWALPGDRMTSVDWSVTSAEFGGTTYGSGTGATTLTRDQGLNQWGYDIQTYSVSGLNVYLNSGTYWLNLQNAVVSNVDPIYWDENDGPSKASESALGTIPSESFDITGQWTCCTGPDGSTPEPGTLTLFGSGIAGLVGLGGALRRRLF